MYQKAFEIELGLRQIPFNREYPVNITYKNQPVGKVRLDFVIADRVVVELKAIEQYAPIHTAKTVSYLKATGFKVGLLLNFNAPVLKDGIKRVIN